MKIADFEAGLDQPFFLIAGPCVIESREFALKTAKMVADITSELGINTLYKSSFDKANRTSIKSGRGIGIQKAMPIFSEIREIVGLPVVTDVHSIEECRIVGDTVDVIQIPAFLCRQTDLLIAAGETGKIVNIKKGQFLAPWDMANVARKVESTGNKNIMLCERGASFGYNTLVSDMRSLAIMAKTGYPIIYDATHSVQQPGSSGDKSGGDRAFAPILS